MGNDIKRSSSHTILTDTTTSAKQPAQADAPTHLEAKGTLATNERVVDLSLELADAIFESASALGFGEDRPGEYRGSLQRALTARLEEAHPAAIRLVPRESSTKKQEKTNFIDVRAPRAKPDPDRGQPYYQASDEGWMHKLPEEVDLSGPPATSEQTATDRTFVLEYTSDGKLTMGSRAKVAEVVALLVRFLDLKLTMTETLIRNIPG